MPPTAEPTLAERILAHLVAYPVEPTARDVPREVTQDGIADALGARVAHVSRALKRLIEDGLVVAHLAHPVGGKRRSRAHSLTDAGYARGRSVAASAPHALVRPRAASVGVPTADAARPPAGRGAEFGALVAALDEAVAGAPRVALVEGDSGSGKSRLLAAFAEEARRRGARVLAAQAAPAGGEQKLGPLGDALAPLGFAARVRARAGGTQHDRLLASAVDSLVAASRQSPVVVVIDDVHHAGAGVAEFLHGIAVALPANARVLVVASFRREEAWELPNGPLYAALAPLRAMKRARHVDLAPLDRAGVEALLKDAGADHVTPELVDRVARESGGNPLYALAMADALEDGVDEEDFFPAVVEATVRERFASIPQPALGVLQIAAVAGAEFDYGLILEACELEGEDAVVDALDLLLDRLLLEEVAHESAGALRLRFEHPKVRDAVLAGMSAARRRFLEQRVAAAHAVAA